MILELLRFADVMEACIMISNEISDVIAYVSSLFNTQIYVCIYVLQDGVIARAKSVIV